MHEWKEHLQSSYVTCFWCRPLLRADLLDAVAMHFLTLQSSALQELDAAMKTFEQLKPQCADAGASYAERKAKRDAEIKSLEEVWGCRGVSSFGHAQLKTDEFPIGVTEMNELHVARKSWNIWCGHEQIAWNVNIAGISMVEFTLTPIPSSYFLNAFFFWVLL